MYPENFRDLYHRYQQFIQDKVVTDLSIEDPVVSGARSTENFGKTLPEMSKVVIYVSHGFSVQPFISYFDKDIEDILSVPYCGLSIAK